ncbi:hypothetical protein [Aeromonas eucrenophila]|uniref:Uncharacterized protein n=1 Tax=Aeromonas eucrenophila TaxID=649 RepID=A0ABW0Y6E1_9GAMM|nr:hypothetical protein [Aeromonas eucrenophila]
MGKNEPAQAPQRVFLSAFKSGLAITVPVGLIPEFIRQDFHMDLFSPAAGRLYLVIVFSAAVYAGITWLFHHLMNIRKKSGENNRVGGE